MTMEIAIGDYLMHHQGERSRGTLVRISARSGDGRYEIDYVQVLESGSVINGGGSFYWSASDFRPITEPELFLAAQAFEAMRLEKQAYADAERHKETQKTAQRAILAIKDARRATCQHESNEHSYRCLKCGKDFGPKEPANV